MKEINKYLTNLCRLCYADALSKDIAVKSINVESLYKNCKWQSKIINERSQYLTNLSRLCYADVLSKNIAVKSINVENLYKIFISDAILRANRGSEQSLFYSKKVWWDFFHKRSVGFMLY